MQSIHERGYCHNDLKSNNIMVDITEDGPKVTIIDFGFMTKVGEIVFKRTLLDEHNRYLLLKERRRNKPFYAPVLYLGGKAQPSTDAFAIAIVTLRLLRGEESIPKSLCKLLEFYADSDGSDCSVLDLLCSLQKYYKSLLK